jgi:preprotein translocase subunit SecA
MSIFKTILHKVVGDPNQKILDNLRPLVEEIAAIESDLETLSDEALRAETQSFKDRFQEGESLDDLLPEAFALVREASRRTTGLRHYDVQMMGGVLLHRGDVVEMRTGEGKTLVATLPLFLNALTGRGVHLVTVNEYLARRDGGWMGKIFYFLGLTVACIGPQQFSALYDPEYVNPGAELEDERLVHWRPCTRRQAYEADITYGISSEFGFDYLRDNMTTEPERLVQRDLHFAVIDEVDNVLIDEARTPLIISGPAPETGKDYQRFAQYMRNLRPNTADEDEDPNGHYDIDEKSRSISLTEIGIAEVERRIEEMDPDAGDSLYDPRFYHLTYYLDNALKAQYLFKRDVDYVVRDGEVIIVDDFTGRLMPGRRYSDGLHEAIEAKEGVQIQRETVTVATITLQNYFRLYEKLAGMTGTAVTDAEEFDEIYGLGVTPLPTNVEFIVQTRTMPLKEERHKENGAEKVVYVDPETEKPRFFKRTDYPDQVYGNFDAKNQAIIQEVNHVHKTGRPVLVGTTSVEHSEVIDKMLKQARIPHYVLNAKQHQSEALIVAQAGRRGSVTISTNMAGRGTDILLGGNAEGLASEVMEKDLFDLGLLTKLAITLFTSGEKEARTLAQKHHLLGEDLVDALKALKADFDAALTEIEKVQIRGYLARSLQAPYEMDYNHLIEVLRLVNAGQFGTAREYVEKLEKDVALIDEIIRLTGLYRRYQQAAADVQRAAQFLAESLFEQHYTARAALIRAVLANKLEEARKIVQSVPCLPDSFIDRIREIVQETEQERRMVWELGGLHVVGSERHESRRIDNQLRGRAARQGDPGSSRFFLSLEDDLMRRFGGERLKNFMTRTNIPEDMPIESGMLDRIIENSQERIEGYNFDIRKNIVEYDDVMNAQRQAIYDERRALLLGQTVDLDERVEEAFGIAIEELVGNYVTDYRAFVRGEMERMVSDFSTDATDEVNVPGVLRQARTLLPRVMDMVDREELETLRPNQIVDRLMMLVHDNEERGHNLYQLLQAMSRFLPLMPPVPNLGSLALRRSGQLQARENARLDFVKQVETLFEEFLADYIEEDEREEIWETAVSEVNEAFAQFNIQSLSLKTAAAQQKRFQRTVNDLLRELLLDSLSALNGEQLIEALTEYVQKQRNKWRERIGAEEFHAFQRLLLLSAIDREWRDYLTAMDDLRREIGLEAVAQRDPKVQYKRRSYEMFADMRRNIQRDIADRFFRQLVSHQDFVQRQQAEVQYQLKASDAGYQVVQRDSGRGVELRRDAPKVGRNDPCPCGSGKKYKQCHGLQGKKGKRISRRK